MEIIDVSAGEILKKTDSELVKLSLANQDDFTYIVDRYEGKLASYIRRLTNANN